MCSADQFAGAVNFSNWTVWLKYYMTGVTKCYNCVTLMLKDSVEYAFKHSCEVFTTLFSFVFGNNFSVSVICATQV